jgi:hypothetical protein
VAGDEGRLAWSAERAEHVGRIDEGGLRIEHEDQYERDGGQACEQRAVPSVLKMRTLALFAVLLCRH